MTFFAVLTALTIDNMASLLGKIKDSQADSFKKELVSLWILDVIILFYTPFWLHLIDSMRIFSLKGESEDDF